MPQFYLRRCILFVSEFSGNKNKEKDKKTNQESYPLTILHNIKTKLVYHDLSLAHPMHVCNEMYHSSLNQRHTELFIHYIIIAHIFRYINICAIILQIFLSLFQYIQYANRNYFNCNCKIHIIALRLKHISSGCH